MEIERDYVLDLAEMIKTLLDNEPDWVIADNGMTVLDAWRDRALKLLSKNEEVRVHLDHLSWRSSE